VDLAEEAVQQLTQATNPAAFFVNIIPACMCHVQARFRQWLVLTVSRQVRYVPEWFPGAGFQTTAKEWAATLNDLAERPFAYVKSQMVIFIFPFDRHDGLLRVLMNRRLEWTFLHTRRSFWTRTAL